MSGREPSPGDPLLTVRGLTAGYGAMVVLRDVTMEVRRAEIVAMVGSNGAGKTTLLRPLSQLIGWQGEVSFDGQALAGSRPTRSSVSAWCKFRKDGNCSTA